MTATSVLAPLLARAAGGDVQALDRLLAVTRPDLGRYARQHCQSQDVEDAVQDALWIIHRRLGSLRNLSAFTGWSFRIIRRLCLGMSIASARRAYEQLDERASDEHAINPEIRLAIVASIAGLPQHYREVLLAIDVLGHTAQATADALGVTLEAAKARLHRARMMVRGDLADHSTTQEVRRGVR